MTFPKPRDPRGLLSQVEDRIKMRQSRKLAEEPTLTFTVELDPRVRGCIALAGGKGASLDIIVDRRREGRAPSRR